MPIDLTKRGETSSPLTATQHDANLTSIETAVNGLEARTTFHRIAVAGQSDLVAGQPGDTLNLAAGSNVSITTTPASDTVTISAAGGGGGGSGGIDVVPITQFGAVAQTYGVASPTNYTSQIQQAIDYAAAQRRPLYVSPGTWYHTGLQLHHSLTMFGASEVLSIFKMIPNTQAHNFRASATDVGNVCLSDFGIDGSEGSYGTPVRDLDNHTWGDGINAQLTGTNTNYVFQALNVPQIADPTWRMERLRIWRVQRHGIYVSGRGEHHIRGVRIGNPTVDGLRINASDCIVSDTETAGTGRNGVLVNGGNCRLSNCKFYFCGERTFRADAETTAMRNVWVEWWAGSNQDTKYGGGCGILVRDSGISCTLMNVEAQDTWGDGIILADAKDCTLYAQSNNVKALRSKYSLGSATLKESAVLRIEGATKGGVIRVTHKDQYNGSGYTTDRVLHATTTTAVGNDIQIRYDSAQPFTAGASNLGATFTGSQANTVSLVGVVKS